MAKKKVRLRVCVSDPSQGTTAEKPIGKCARAKIGKWGRSSAFGANGDALYTIKQAYDFLVSILRWRLDLYSTIIYLLQGTALFVLGLSVFFRLLSYAPSARAT